MNTKLIQMTKKDEGFRSKPYRCSEGKLTIGYGTNIEDGITKEEAELLLVHRLEKASVEVAHTFDFFSELSLVRKDVLTMMNYNMGLGRLLTFKKMIFALAQKDYEEASIQMLDSKWANQVGQRAFHLSAMMKFDTYEV